MKKKFIIVDDDHLFCDLIETQVSEIFKYNFDIKFIKVNNLKIVDDLFNSDLIIINVLFVKNDKCLLKELEQIEKTKIIIMYNNGEDRFQFKKFSKYNFLIKPFKLKQLIDIINDLFASYETNQTSINITQDLIFKPETKILLNKKNNLSINLTEKESKLLNFILDNKAKILKKHTILNYVWGINKKINTHTLETHIYSLKKKLDHFNYEHSFICSDNLGGYYFKDI